jgi:hypothetical protein
MRFRLAPFSFLSLAVLLLVGVQTANAQRSAHTLPRGIDQLTTEADLIVRGAVLSAKVEPHPELKNLKTVLISLRVDETWKGTAAKTLEFRQYIWDIRDELDAARYRKGEALLLFLGPTSQYGLRSPVGLEQGRFQLLRDKAGQIVAVNGRHNAGLFDGADERSRAKGIQLSTRSRAVIQRKAGGPVGLDDLRSVVREVEGAKSE